MSRIVTTVAGRLAGSRVLVLNWRDTRHPQAGGAEQYMHEICRRWVEQGVDVTWFTANVADRPRRESLTGSGSSGRAAS